MSDELLDNDRIIRSSSVLNETSLARANDLWKEGLNSEDNDFGDQLVKSIIESNRPKVLNMEIIRTLRY